MKKPFFASLRLALSAWPALSSLAIFAPLAAYSQGIDSVYWPYSSSESWYIPDRPWSISRFEASQKGNLEVGDYLDILTDLKEEFSDEIEVSAGLQPLGKILLGEMDSLILEFRLVNADLETGFPLDTLPIRTDRFNTGLVAGSQGKMCLFCGRTGKEMAFDPDSLPLPTARFYRSAAWTVDALMKVFMRPYRGRTLAEIHRARRRWDNFVIRGYSQYPWEALINPWKGDIEHPPSCQLIAFHPSIGYEFFPELSNSWESEGRQIVMLEVAGLVFYIGSEWQTFIGLAGMVTMGEKGSGVGGLGHIGNWGHFGAAYYPESPVASEGSWSLTFSLDILRFAGKTKKTYNAAKMASGWAKIFK